MEFSCCDSSSSSSSITRRSPYRKSKSSLLASLRGVSGASVVGASADSVHVSGNSSMRATMISSATTTTRGVLVPHEGALCRVEQQADDSSSNNFSSETTYSPSYVLEIAVEVDDDGSNNIDNKDENHQHEQQQQDPLAGRTRRRRTHNNPRFLIHELVYTRRDFEFAQRLFAILDTESRGLVDRASIQEFVTLRCPVFWRRDEDLLLQQHHRHHNNHHNNNDNNSSNNNNDLATGSSPTFDEIWNSVVKCCRKTYAAATTTTTQANKNVELLGVEGWMVFCRFIALAQYLEGKRRFSARHNLQQTVLRHRNSQLRGSIHSEVVVVDVPPHPPEPPAPLTARQLANYETRMSHKSPLPVPELDLDHSMVAAHDYSSTSFSSFSARSRSRGFVKINLFGSSYSMMNPSSSSSFCSSSLLSHHHHHIGSGGSSSGTGPNNLEFAVTFVRQVDSSTSSCVSSSSSSGRSGTTTTTTTTEETVVRRSMSDLKWLDDTFTAHKALGGTLCGRILPPFPALGEESSVLLLHNLSTPLKTTSGAITAAAASGVGRIRDAAKSLLGSSYRLTTSYMAGGGGAADNSAQGGGTSSGGGGGSGGGPGPSSSSSSFSAANKKHLKKSSLGGCNSSSSTSSSSCRTYPESYYNPYSPLGRARHLERYLNYLLEHPALSTSFPLNTILKASQSGLEAAKESLDEVARATKEIKDQTPQLDDGKITIPFWPSGLSSSDSSSGPNLAWVRTAAQAAMALKVHGMLETTGMNSASARLQHASLPSLASSARNNTGWEDDEGHHSRHYHGAYYPRQSGRPCGRESSLAAANHQEDTEVSNFEEGVVNVQSELLAPSFEPVGDDGYDLLPLPVPAPERRILSAGSDACAAAFVREGRFHYGTSSVENSSAVQVDSSENKASKALLGDIVVDENIGKLREVIGSVENTLARCLASIGGIGKAQRERQSLHLEVVRGLDSWGGMRGKFISQRSLLKGVAGIEQSKEIYEEGDVMMIDDISWQNSLAKSAVSAAEDVRSAVRVSRTAANAKAAASAAAFAAQNACETLTFANISEARAAQTRASIAHSHAIHAAVVDHEAKSVMRRSTLALAHDVKCWNVHRKREMLQSCVAYARSQHEATRRAVDAWSSLRDGFIGTTAIPSAHERRSATIAVAPLPPAPPPARVEPRQPAPMDANEVTATIFTDMSSGVGNAEGQTAIVAVDHHVLSTANAIIFHEETQQVKLGQQFKGGICIDPFESSDLILPFATAAPIPEVDEDDLCKSTTSVLKDDRTVSRSVEHDPDASATTEEALSASMQSLIDGLMLWGEIETDEDHFALPAGMAASIALGERNASKIS